MRLAPRFAFAINAFDTQNALYLVSEGYCTYVWPSIGCSEAKARAQAIFGRLASLGKHSLTALQLALRYNNSKHLRRAPPLQ